MSAASPDPIRLLRAPPARPAGAPGRRSELAIAAAAAVAVLAAIAYFASSGPRGLRGVPPVQRAAALSRTVDEIRDLCGPGHDAALDDHCRELASFAARFDECRGECEALVRPLLTPTPTR